MFACIYNYTSSSYKRHYFEIMALGEKHTLSESKICGNTIDCVYIYSNVKIDECAAAIIDDRVELDCRN